MHIAVKWNFQRDSDPTLFLKMFEVCDMLTRGLNLDDEGLNNCDNVERVA